ncbi:MAG: hypothetical protein AAF799_16280 [Myxococcota bacterium]
MNKTQCPHCDHEVAIHSSLPRMGAVLGAAVGAASRRGLGLGGLVRGAAIGGGVAYVLERMIGKHCPSCHGTMDKPQAQS